MVNNVRLRFGEVEISTESDNPFSSSEVKELMGQFHGILTTLSSLTTAEASSDELSVVDSDNGKPTVDSPPPKLHINSVANQLSVKSGPELLIAAAAYLQIFEGKATFSREELLATMRLANSHCNKSCASNFSAYLKKACEEKINHLKNNSYSLKSDVLNRLKGELGQS